MAYQLRTTVDRLADLMSHADWQPGELVRVPLAVNRRDGDIEFLMGPQRLDARRRRTAAVAGLVTTPGRLRMVAEALRALRLLPRNQPALALCLGRGPASGWLAAVCRDSAGTIEPLQRIDVAGAGLRSIVLADAIRPSFVDLPDGTPRDTEFWSRTAGALGSDTWLRLRQLRFCIVGCGRSGSQMAHALARFGARRLTLVDPDRVEAHNLGEMDLVELSDIDAPKVEAVARHLPWFDRIECRRVFGDIHRLSGLHAVRDADLVVSTVDNARARAAVSFLATLYLRPHLDVGTAVMSQGAARELGGDVRLVLPGRCLSCFGGIGPLEPEPPDEPGGDVRNRWRQQRAGSLRSLNQIAVGLALRALEDLADGRLHESTWLRVEFSPGGIPSLQHVVMGRPQWCRQCAVTGWGDAGLTVLGIGR